MFKSVMSNRNCLLGQKLCRYLNERCNIEWLTL